MNHLWPVCWQECRRLAARFSWRSQLWLLRRRLCVAERQLGELGWQQADFDPNDRGARELQAQEQEQARLVFDIAELKEQIAELKSVSRTRLSELHQQIETCETDAAAREAHALRLAQVLEAERARKAALYLIESDEKALAADEAALRDTRARLQSLQEILARDEAHIRTELDLLQTNLRTLEAQLRELLEKKTIHFGHIGQELADVGIAPLNQPGVLTQVLALREKITDLDFQLTYSLSHPPTLRIHLAALALFTCLLVAALFVLLSAIALAWKMWHR
ncbi:MAG: hypothetical protein ABIT76_13965 [Chthoniobacterales bacterium]